MKNDERNSIEVEVVQIKSNWLEFGRSSDGLCKKRNILR